ncbi:MAG: thioesterase domain-containing protein [Alteromonadaceae bacterium]|jgi:thioesterase domain-containing protein
MNVCRAPKNKQEFEDYLQLRWLLLRQPWHQPLGSEQDEYEQQAIHRLIVNDNNEFIAVGRLHKTDQYHAQLRYMGVSPNMQGRGLGAQLLSSLEQEARIQGVKIITLNAREDAIGFYQRLAYQQGEFSHLLYDDIKHFTMSKTLSSTNLHHNIDTVKELQETWHRTIPASKAMGIDITHFDGNSFVATCDLIFNKNLHNTMFAGSIYTLATLTGWGWVHMQLVEKQQQGSIVLADANIRYHSPLKGAAHAITEANLCHGEVNTLSTGKKAKLKVTVNVCCGDIIAATFTGLYFVIP